MKLINSDNLYELIRCDYPFLHKELEQYSCKYFSNNKLKNDTNESLNGDLMSTINPCNVCQEFDCYGCDYKR